MWLGADSREEDVTFLLVPGRCGQDLPRGGVEGDAGGASLWNLAEHAPAKEQGLQARPANPHKQGSGGVLLGVRDEGSRLWALV